MEISKLKDEITGLKRVKFDQEKALTKLTEEQEFPSKLKIIADENKILKTREWELQDRIKAGERVADQHFA